MNFEDIKNELFNNSKVVSRLKWISDDCQMWLFKQIPCTIYDDNVIKNMQSLSDDAKDLILNTNKFISYQNQIISYNTKTGVATYYTVTIEDLIATDWIIYKTIL